MTPSDPTRPMRAIFDSGRKKEPNFGDIAYMTQSDPTREALREAGAWIAALGTDEASIVAANIEAALAALPTTPTPSLDAERLASAMDSFYGKVPGTMRDSAEAFFAEAARLAALSQTEPQPTPEVPEWNDDDDLDHSAFTHRDDDEPPPYSPSPSVPVETE